MRYRRAVETEVIATLSMTELRHASQIDAKCDAIWTSVYPALRQLGEFIYLGFRYLFEIR